MCPDFFLTPDQGGTKTRFPTFNDSLYFTQTYIAHMEKGINIELFAAIPEEILVKILQYVSIADVPAVCSVNKRLNALMDINMKQDILDNYVV
jgi:hypothetical protein